MQSHSRKVGENFLKINKRGCWNNRGGWKRQWILIIGGDGIIGGLETSIDINNRGGWNNRGSWKFRRKNNKYTVSTVNSALIHHFLIIKCQNAKSFKKSRRKFSQN